MRMAAPLSFAPYLALGHAGGRGVATYGKVFSGLTLPPPRPERGSYLHGVFVTHFDADPPLFGSA